MYAVESRETEYKTVIQELIEKEQSMKDVIQDKDTESVRLRKQLGIILFSELKLNNKWI